MDRGKSTANDAADYVAAAEALYHSMRFHGYDESEPIPVGMNGEIMGGAHRLACALVLDIDALVRPVARQSWAPAWDRQWFIGNAMPDDDLARLDADWAALTRTT